MKIAQTHSRFNGLEFLQVHKPHLLDEIWQAIQSIRDTEGKLGPSIENLLVTNGWQQTIVQNVGQIGLITKDRVALTQGAFFAYHLAFYIGDEIDVGIEILPMKSLQSQMSSGIGYYEGELYNVIRQGRGVPAVPLVLLGVDA